MRRAPFYINFGYLVVARSTAWLCLGGAKDGSKSPRCLREHLGDRLSRLGLDRCITS